MTNEKLNALRSCMEKDGVSVYLITSTDFHASEYVGDYFKVSEYVSGCTSDNVTLLVEPDRARLWTDGRYFISAAAELKDSGIELMKMGEPGVPEVEAYLEERLQKDGVLAFDGRCVSVKKGLQYREIAARKGASVRGDKDYASLIWENRPPMPSHPGRIRPEEIAGCSVREKVEPLRGAVRRAGANYLLLSKLDDLMDLLNIRGADITCNPVALSYGLIGTDSFDFFIQESEVTGEFRDYCKKLAVSLHPYEELRTFLTEKNFSGPVLLDPVCTGYALYELLRDRVPVVMKPNPTELPKAMRTPAQIERTKEYYLLDSAAVCRFIFWVKKHIGKIRITELSAAEKMDSLRREIPGYLDLSFPTISAWGPNAAMAHYAATEENQSEVKPEGFLLVDSGGQYLGATTDVTRTIAVGPLTPEMKRDFTLVAAGNLALLTARFRYGCTGRNLDTYARAPLWARGMDYNHGTGHGIGYILNVHEGPQSIRWKYIPELAEAVFEEGMVTSDEPGIYIEGKYGIRTESIVLCVKDMENEFGSFMRFEPLTWAPIDLDAIDTGYLSDADIRRLNDYHREVREKILPLLNEEEGAWLIEATREI